MMYFVIRGYEWDGMGWDGMGYPLPPKFFPVCWMLLHWLLVLQR